MTSLHELSGPTVVCLTTYDRLDCARINQEIIKLNYGNRCGSFDYYNAGAKRF